MQEENRDGEFIHTAKTSAPVLTLTSFEVSRHIPNSVPPPTPAPVSKNQEEKSISNEVTSKEDPTEPRVWKSSCHECSPKLLLFLAQVWFSSFLIILSVYMIVQQGPGSAPNALWVSILTSTATLWLPSPQFQHGAPSKN